MIWTVDKDNKVQKPYTLEINNSFIWPPNMRSIRKGHCISKHSNKVKIKNQSS